MVELGLQSGWAQSSQKAIDFMLCFGCAVVCNGDFQECMDFWPLVVSPSGRLYKQATGNGLCFHAFLPEVDLSGVRMVKPIKSAASVASLKGFSCRDQVGC